MRVDLHIHTQASDGTWTPQELIEQLQHHGIQLFAVSDHDSVTNSLACSSLISSTGLQMIPSVEICSSFNGIPLHVQAYGADLMDTHLDELLVSNRRATEEAQFASLELLIDAGFPIQRTAYFSYHNNPARGGWKMLNFLIDTGLCVGLKDLMGRLFNEERRLIEPVYTPTVSVIETILAAGGIPILAHPGLQRQTLTDAHIVSLVEAGLRGLECYTPYHDEAITRKFKHFCDDYNLLITGGSDCHGDFVPERRLGVPKVTTRDLRLGEIVDAVVGKG